MAGTNPITQLPGLTMAYSNSLLTATGAETVHDTTVRLDFSIDGIMYSKSGTNADQTTPTTDVNTAAAMTLVGTATAGQACVFVWMYNKDGTVKVAQGPKVATDVNGTIQAGGALLFPYIDFDTYCPFAIMVSKHYGQASTFTFGSSNWNTSGYTHTIYNIATLPNRPQT